MIFDEYVFRTMTAVTYRRLTGTPMEIYQHLEPLLTDYSKLRYRKADGSEFTCVELLKVYFSWCALAFEVVV